jgi:serine/threonine protein phosphatase PrpC
MEDAHLIHLRQAYGIFGVFDGHGGEQCSKWVAKRLQDEFETNGCPEDDAAVKKLFLQVDREFLDTEQGSGTTATMCIVHKPASGGNDLTVINAGDSRVLLGRRDGTIVDGGGTDQGLTIDHKPNEPRERERIERCGGTVEIAAGGVARLNGDLAVSRGFGDKDYKKQGPVQADLENQPSTASPEFGSFKCDDADFLLLVCDGVSEGDFPNPEVVKFVADRLQESDDIGEAARGVCQKAVDKNSKDNVTCMIVLLRGEPDVTDSKHSQQFIPGPIEVTDNNFLKAYTAMADKAGKTLWEAVMLRYEEIEGNSDPELQKEKELIGDPKCKKGSEEYEPYFKKWADENPKQEEGGEVGGLPASLLQRLLAGGTNFAGPPDDGKDSANAQKVRTPPLAVLKPAIEKHAQLQWDERHAQLADKVGTVQKVDSSDGTTQVKFEPAPSHQGMTAWLPSDILIDEES